MYLCYKNLTTNIDEHFFVYLHCFQIQPKKVNWVNYTSTFYHQRNQMRHSISVYQHVLAGSCQAIFERGFKSNQIFMMPWHMNKGSKSVIIRQPKQRMKKDWGTFLSVTFHTVSAVSTKASRLSFCTLHWQTVLFRLHVNENFKCHKLTVLGTYYRKCINTLSREWAQILTQISSMPSLFCTDVARWLPGKSHKFSVKWSYDTWTTRHLFGNIGQSTSKNAHTL